MLKNPIKYIFLKLCAIFKKSCRFFYRDIIPEQTAIYFTVG